MNICQTRRKTDGVAIVYIIELAIGTFNEIWRNLSFYKVKRESNSSSGWHSRYVCECVLFPFSNSTRKEKWRVNENECVRQRSDVQNARFTRKFVRCQWSKHLQKVNLSLIRLKKTYGFSFYSFFPFYALVVICSLEVRCFLFPFCLFHRCQSRLAERCEGTKMRRE